LAFLSLGLPAFFFWPICYRLFQILKKINVISAVTLGAVITNGFLNYIFMKRGFGIKGVAFATSIANYIVVAGAVVHLHTLGTRVVTVKMIRVLLITVVVSAASLASTFLIPVGAENPAGLLLRGGGYLAAVAILLYHVRNDEIRNWRDTVMAEIFPARRNVTG
jgi:peptidoglycan biosynthesis protein MviN/MurJ (putative lipid II flippase)